MKTIQIIFFAVLMFSCSQNKEETKLAEEYDKPTLTIQIDDESQSADHLQVPMSELKKLLTNDAIHGGCQIVSLRITDNSEKQNPWMSDLVKASIQDVRGSYYDKKNAQKHNKEALIVLQKSIKSVMDSLIQRLPKEKKGKKSDINGALQMAAQLADSFTAKGFKVRLLVFSDLIQDSPKTQLLHPVSMPKATQIILIGAHLDLDVVSVFPDNMVERVPVFKVDYELEY